MVDIHAPAESLLADVSDSVQAARLAIKQAAAQRDAALAARDAAIRRALNGGWSLRKVSAASGLSVAQVHRVSSGVRTGTPPSP